jgi:hypothetical protein
MAKKPYNERTDAEKVRSNWNKTLRLFDHREYSVCVLRAAIACELAVNLVLFVELSERHNLNREFAAELLRDANGITNKFNKLLLKILKGHAAEQTVKDLKKTMERINKERNFVLTLGSSKHAKRLERCCKMRTSSYPH